MAKIVLGLGVSHSPLVNEPPQYWAAHGEAEKRNTELIASSYGGGDVEELTRRKEGYLSKEVTLEKFQERYEAAQKGIDAMRKTLSLVKPDVLVIVGDDQQDAFLSDYMPAMCIYTGAELVNPPRNTSNWPEWRRASAWGFFPEKEPERYPCESGLALHLVKSLIAQEFDVAFLKEPREGRPVGHAFTFIARRILKGTSISMVPFLLDTYFPPVQPTVPRSYALGKALRAAIESWPSDKTVALLASGGLSHFVVDEGLDKTFLELLEKKDELVLTGMDENIFRSGTSELKNWIVVAGALADSDLTMKTIDYIPGYRTTAGTGCGLAFAQWTLGGASVLGTRAGSLQDEV